MGIRSLTAAALAAAALSFPSASAETLEEAVRAAFRTNPQLGVQRTEAEIAGEALREARGARRPRIDVSGSYGYQDITTNQVFAFGIGEQTVASAQGQLVQPIYTGGRISSGIRGARAGVGAADAALDGVGQDTILQTVTAYMDVIRDAESVRIQENSVSLLEEQQRAARDRFEVGEVTRTDVAQAEAQLAESRAGLAAALAQLEASRAAYAFVVGTPPGELAPPPPRPAVPDSFEQTVEIALDQNPDIIAARLQEAAAAEAVTTARSTLLPQLSLVGTAAYEETFLEGQQRTTNFSAIAQATVPLYEGGVLRSQVRSAKLQRESARLQIATIDRFIRADAARAWYSHVAALRSIEASRSRVEAAEIAYEGSLNELSVGVRTTLDTLDQEQDLLEARLSLVSAERDAFVTAYEILRVAGALDLGLLAGGAAE
ncbi:MAG: TolC family outer membrane protein [Pseudomonadota bacterium]